MVEWDQLEFWSSKMHKTKINSSEFAKRLGAYSHGYKIEIGDTILVFTTGQIALDKES